MGFILKNSFQTTSGFLNLNVSTAPTGYTVNYALVGGGGSGGFNWGGGGGAGQVVQSTTNLAFSTLYNIVVGTGVTGTSYGNPSLPIAYPSIFATAFAYGGGSGGNGILGYTNGNNGGSGGGACSGYSLNLTNTIDSYGGTATSGYAGGDSIAPRISGGGGGAGSIGGSGTLTGSGNGGAGVAITISGYSAGTFAGGGGGGAYTGFFAGSGGSSIGGAGAALPNANGGNATANTGSGGGGNAGGGGGVGGSGASGIVILSIPTANYPGDAYVNGGVADSSVWTKTTSGSNTILTFKKNSTYASSAGTPLTTSYNINALAVGGGGGGGSVIDLILHSYAGGNGGSVFDTSIDPEGAIIATTGTTYTISTGVGGQGGGYEGNVSNNASQSATNGGNSTIKIGASPILVVSGGAALSVPPYYGGNGSAGSGEPGDPTQGGNGGTGVESYITGNSVFYGGGGGGGGISVGDNGDGLIGQGGAGANGNLASNGQNGVVILSIPINNYTGKITGNPSFSVNGSNVILTYNNSGTYTA